MRERLFREEYSVDGNNEMKLDSSRCCGLRENGYIAKPFSLVEYW